jgi:hypothetical protein
LEQLNSLNISPEQQTKRLEGLKIYNESKEALEHLKCLNLRNKGRARPEGAGRPSVHIEVFDTLNNVKTVYPSISKAAQAIGMSESSIYMAFTKHQGVSTILIKKKRYQITKLSK